MERLRIENKSNPLGVDVPRPAFSWQLRAAANNVLQEAYRLQIARDERFASLIWDTGKMVSDQSVHVVYNGPELASRTRYFVRVRVWDTHGVATEWSKTAYWETAFFSASEWTAEWITPQAAAIDPDAAPCHLLRKTFVVGRKVKSARIYATCLGLFELHLNGRRVGDLQLTPGWTSYRHRLQYQTYDVTDQLFEGDNALGIVVGNGWYKGMLTWHNKVNLFGDRRAALLQLHIIYEDGGEEVVATDATWKAATGPILMSEIYHGETYDARLEKEGWTEAGYREEGWCPVEVLKRPKEILVAQENPPCRIIQTIKPIGVIRTPSGDTVLDMGQNMVGWVEFRVEAAPGTRIVLRHAEVLDRDGNFYTGNLRSAKQTIEYICKGGGVERFAPHFTFQGFRYVAVEGFPGEINPDDFTGQVVCSDMEQTGSFTCSEALINQLQRNIEWGQRGNFVDVPTDCPQRDERLGWTGDAQVFIRTAAFLTDVASFFAKWLRDLKADQLPNGGVPHVIPHVLDENSHSSAAWGDAAVICPWTLYLCYGDKRILEEQYDSMKAWVNYMRMQGDDEFLFNTGAHFGDWLGLDAKENSYIGATPFDLIATAFYAYSTRLVAKSARILGKTGDAESLEKLYENIVDSFNREFVTPNGRLAAHTQTACALALMFDLVEGKAKERTAAALVKLVEAAGYHLTTGFVGTPYLCLALTKAGYHDVAAKIVMQQDYPSWLYPITRGATTIWEHWDGIKEDGSFWSDEMNSYNHYAYGSIGEWFYRIVAGIDTDEDRPVYKHIRFRPHPVAGWSFAKAVLQTLYGEVRSEWAVNEADSGLLTLSVAIPANTTATIELPPGFIFADTGRASFELGSGAYTFTLRRL
ncbi:MAG TPA: family 78 glycoside hydrolase catalytic domain [Bacilli bacterium]